MKKTNITKDIKYYEVTEGEFCESIDCPYFHHLSNHSTVIKNNQLYCSSSCGAGKYLCCVERFPNEKIAFDCLFSKKVFLVKVFLHWELQDYKERIRERILTEKKDSQKHETQ